MLTRSLCAVLSVLPFALGCYDSVPVTDAPSRDMGPTARDGGPGRDAFVPRRDAFVPPPIDAGGDVCVTGERLAPYAGPTCRPETAECLEGCGADPDPGFCQDECFAADETCVQCLNETVIRCAANNGCQAEWDEYACCSEELCPGAVEVDRLICSDDCTSQLELFVDCLNDRALGVCEAEFEGCLAP